MADSRSLQLRVGLLVIIGMALAVGFVLFLTASRLRGTDLIFETYIRESVQGLDVGSPVRYRGVQIGRVTFIGLVSAEYRRPEGEPFVGAFQLVVVRFAVDENRLGDVPTVQDAVKLGLRARLASQGITGVTYLELDFVSPERYPPMEVPWGPRYPYVPAIPSTVAQVTSVAESLLQRLEEADLPGLVSNFGNLIEDLRGELNGGDVQRMLREATVLLQALRQAADGASVPQVSTELRALIADLRATAADARAILDGREVKQVLGNTAAAAAELRAAMQRLPASLTAIEQTLRSARGASTDLQAELVPLLRDLRATVANLRATSEALRRAPAQTIFGAPPPQPEGRR